MGSIWLSQPSAADRGHSHNPQRRRLERRLGARARPDLPDLPEHEGLEIMLFSRALPLLLLACSARASDGIARSVERAWRELEAHCAAGRCALHSGSVKLRDLANTTDCKGRMLAYEYALALIPERALSRP